MENNYEILEWDSEFFGFKVAKIDIGCFTINNLESVFCELNKMNVKLVYLSSKVRLECLADSIHSYTGKFVDEKVTFVRNLESVFSLSPNIAEFEESIPSSQLLLLAHESGKYSRFRVDEKIGKEKFEQLYRLWIENSVNKTIASNVLCYAQHGETLGMITMGEKNNNGDVGIVAVAPNARGKGVGIELINSAMHLFQKQGYSNVQVVTQGINIPACKLYERCGFNRKNVEFMYHFWQK